MSRSLTALLLAVSVSVVVGIVAAYLIYIVAFVATKLRGRISQAEPLGRPASVGSAEQSEEVAIPVNVGIQWRWLLDLPGRLVAVVTLLGWLLSLVSASWLYVTAKNLKRVEAAKVNTTEIFNEQYFLDQKEDYERFKGVAEPFTLGTSAKIQRGETLALTGTVRFPLGCKDYWIVFLSDNLVWPKVNIRNTGLQYQHVNVRIAVPPQFQKGKLALACVLDKTHQQFEAWLAEGRDAPLLRPSRLDVALVTNIATPEGGSR